MKFTLKMLLTLAAMLLASASMLEVSEKRLNILFIVVDEMNKALGRPEILARRVPGGKLPDMSLLSES